VAPPSTRDNSPDPEGAVMVSRPSGVSAQSYEKVSNAYFTAVHSVLTGEKPAAESAAELQTELTKITGFRRRATQQN